MGIYWTNDLKLTWNGKEKHKMALIIFLCSLFLAIDEYWPHFVVWTPWWKVEMIWKHDSQVLVMAQLRLR